MTSEKFETIVITTNGNNRNVRLPEQEHNEVHTIHETQLSQNDEAEDVQVLKRTIFYGTKLRVLPGCSTRTRQSKIIVCPKIINLSSYSLSKNQKKLKINKRSKIHTYFKTQHN